MFEDRREASLETGALVRAGVEDHAVDAELVRGPQVAGEGALRARPHGGVVAGQVDQVDGMKVEGWAAELRGGLLESRDPSLVQLWRAPEPRRRWVDLDRLGAHGLGAFVREVQPPGRVDVGTDDRHPSRLRRAGCGARNPVPSAIF